jgi:putative phosphonate catabolism associated alcohol dehydrogenase
MAISRTAVFKEAGIPFEIIEVTIPELKSGEILIRNLYATLCRSDLYTFTGQRKEKSPTILGHEVTGLIEEFGPNALLYDERGTFLKVGDRVTWAIYASDPTSPLALNGIPQKSNNLFKYGHEKLTDESTLHGGLSEYTILRMNTPILKIGDNISNKFAATINCTVATVAGAVRLAGGLKGKSVGIIGVGMLGTIACAMCRIYGAESIIAFDIDRERLKNAERFGTDHTVNLLEANEYIDLLPKTDILLEFSGYPDTIEKSMDLLGIGGVAVWVGATFPQKDVQINAEKIVRNLHSIKGLHNYNNHDLVNAVNMIELHFSDFPFDEMVEAEFPLEKVNEAFQYAIEHNPYRVGINLSRDH